MNEVFYTQVFPELLVRASYPGDPEHTDALLTLPSRLTSSSAAMTPGAAWPMSWPPTKKNSPRAAGNSARHHKRIKCL